MRVKLTGRSALYSGWLKLYRADLLGEDGTSFHREVEDHGPAAAVLPYDPERRVALLVSLPRAPLIVAGESELLIEAPAGIVDGQESGEAAARREAEEETGVVLRQLEPLGAIWTMPGISTERMSLFLAAYEAGDRVSQGGGLAEENENITVLELPLGELARRADAGLLTDMKTLLLVQTLRLRRPDLFT